MYNCISICIQNFIEKDGLECPFNKLYLSGLTVVYEVLSGIKYEQFGLKRLLEPTKFQCEEGARQRLQDLLQDKSLQWLSLCSYQHLP